LVTDVVSFDWAVRGLYRKSAKRGDDAELGEEAEVIGDIALFGDLTVAHADEAGDNEGDAFAGVRAGECP